MFRALFATILLLNIGLLQACGGGDDAAPEFSDALSGPAGTPVGNSAPVITGSAPLGKENSSYKFTPVVTDPDGDPLDIAISNLPSWLTFNSVTGELTGIPGVEQIGTYTGIVLTASDGSSTTRLTFSLEVRFDELEQALRTGDHRYISSEAQLISGVLSTIENNVDRYRSLKRQLFNLSDEGAVTADALTQVSWDPTQDAALLKSRFGSNEALLTTNAVSNRSYLIQEHALVIAGENQNSRYAVFGGNPMRNEQRSSASLSDDMRTLLNNTLNWLVDQDTDSQSSVNVVLTQFDESFYFPDQSSVRSWLDRTYGDRVSYNAAKDCNSKRLEGCITPSTDLLLISPFLFDGDDADAVVAQVETALREGVSVAYFHHDGDLGPVAQRLLALFDVDYQADNYWRKLAVENYDVSSEVADLPAEVQNTKALVTRFLEQSFSIKLNECDDKSCPSDSPYYDEFRDPVDTLRDQLIDMDQQGVRLFESGDYRYQKLLVLLGDFYRHGVSYPMDKTVTPTTLFLRSLYADHSVYYSRGLNPAQRDMGNFSRSNYSHVTKTTRTLSLMAKPPFRSTGAYALPGVPFTVTRHDNNDVVTHVFINTVRPGATHEFEQFGYTRPKHLRSSEFLLENDKPLVLTSPHGGPIQVSFDGRDQTVNLTFSTVGEHPYWTSSTDDAAFSAALARGNFDWAELVTDNFEVHSTLDQMRTTMSDPVWNSASKIAQAVSTYTHNNPHVLAGFQGPGIDIVPEIHDFAARNDLDVAVIDEVKHMNADQATCGYGCSGNPYDAYWSFDPLGHGDLHEMGHGLESSRFRFAGWDSHSSTNYYSYYSKYRYFEQTGDIQVLGGCQELPFSELFTTAQQSVNAAVPADYMRGADLTGWDEGTGIFLQLMMRAQADGALSSGWNLLPRLHIVEREFARFDDSDADWLAARDGLGFESLSRTDARRLDNNDWLLIALSHVTARDLRNYFTAWGLEFSEVAGNLVREKNLPGLNVELHVLEANAYCLSLDHPSVPVDGVQAWPLGK